MRPIAQIGILLPLELCLLTSPLNAKPAELPPGHTELTRISATVIRQGEQEPTDGELILTFSDYPRPGRGALFLFKDAEGNPRYDNYSYLEPTLHRYIVDGSLSRVKIRGKTWNGTLQRIQFRVTAAEEFHVTKPIYAGGPIVAYSARVWAIEEPEGEYDVYKGSNEHREQAWINLEDAYHPSRTFTAQCYRRLKRVVKRWKQRLNPKSLFRIKKAE